MVSRKEKRREGRQRFRRSAIRDAGVGVDGRVGSSRNGLSDVRG